MAGMGFMGWNRLEYAKNRLEKAGRGWKWLEWDGMGWIGWNRLEYVGICWNKLEYAGNGWNGMEWAGMG